VISLAADVGEGAGVEAALLPLLDAANVCCGMHAGDPVLTYATVRSCLELGVAVGAHPGFADREGFGRVDAGLTASEIEDLLVYQVAAVAALSEPVFVKPHGALYHRCQADAEAARVAARVAERFGAGIVGQPGFALLEAARALGIPAWREGYADRGYLPDGRLVPRGQPGDLLDVPAAAAQALRLVRSGEIDVLCLHGDSPHAVEVARAVRETLHGASLPTGPLRHV